MASPIIIPKKSTIADKVPLPEQLEGGEVSVNWADQVWHGKHPSTNAVVPIGAPALHSHDELYSLDKSQHLELQNNGSLLLNGSTTLTLPSASGTLATLDDITAGGGGGTNAADSYSEPTYTNGVLTSLATWSNNTKAVLVETKAFSYTNGNLTQIVVKDGNNATTLTKTLNYSGGNLASITEDYA
jgi:hypothetical protein